MPSAFCMAANGARTQGWKEDDAAGVWHSHRAPEELQRGAWSALFSRVATLISLRKCAFQNVFYV